MRILLLLIVFLYTANSQLQPDCALRPFPSKIPLTPNNTLLLDLDLYFSGNNLTYTVSSSPSAILPAPWTCMPLLNRQIGQIVASRYHRPVLALLIRQSSGQNSVAVWNLNTQQFQKWFIPLQNAKQCIDIALRPINLTHNQIVIDCNNPKIFHQRVIVHATVRWQSGADWVYVSADLFTSKKEGIKVGLELGKGYLLRSVMVPQNSYLEVRSMGEVSQILWVVDKTQLGLNKFYIKRMQLTHNTIILLDYYSGIHILKMPGNLHPIQISTFLSPLFEYFTYDTHTQTLVLAKKGKILLHQVSLTDTTQAQFKGSYNIYNYQNVRDVFISSGKLVVLGQSVLNVFSLSQDTYDSRYYQLYSIDNTKQIYLSEQLNQGIKIMLVKNSQRTVSLSSCQLTPSLLMVTRPSSYQTIVIGAISQLQGHKIVCQQKVMLYPLNSTQNIIYDNGYSPENQTLYANLGGNALVPLQKYGLASRLKYTVIPSLPSNLEYQWKILKLEQSQCYLDNKPLVRNNFVIMSTMWQQVMAVQFGADYLLRYYACRGQNRNTNCSYLTDIPLTEAISSIAHYTLRKSQNEKIVLSAYGVSNNGSNFVAVQQIKIYTKNEKKPQISLYCTIKLSSQAKSSKIIIHKSTLYLLFIQLKTIKAYDLRQQQCSDLYNLTATTLKTYFAPRNIYFWQNVLLVQQWNQLLAIRVDNNKHTLLSTTTLPFIDNFYIKNSPPYLIVSSAQANQVIIYHLDHKYQLFLLKKIDLKEMKIQDISPTLLDPLHLGIVASNSKNRYFRVFKIDSLIPTGQQYFRIPLQQSQTALISNLNNYINILLLQVTKNSPSFLICQSKTTHLSPSLSFFFNSSFIARQQLSQTLTLKLQTQDELKQYSLRIVISNVGNSIKPGSRYPLRGEGVKAQVNFTIDDTNWFSGSVFQYQYACKDCDQRIKFLPKMMVEKKDELPIMGDMFWVGKDSLEMLVGGSLIHLKQNVSVWPIQNQTKPYDIGNSIILSANSVKCQQAILNPYRHTIVSLCSSSIPNTYYLSLTSTVSLKSHTILQTKILLIGPHPKMFIKNDILVIWTADQAVLYTVWFLQQQYQVVQLDIVDRQDIAGNICYVQLISNATENSTVNINRTLFGLMVTQCSSKIYYTTFSIYLQPQQTQQGKPYLFPVLHTSSSSLISIPSLFAQNSIRIPIQSLPLLTLLTYISNIGDYSLYSIFLLFDKFHSYQFRLRINKDTLVIRSIQLDGVFYKYDQYEAREVRFGDEGLVAVRFVNQRQGFVLDEVYALYDRARFMYSKEYVRQYHIFWTHSLRNKPHQQYKKEQNLQKDIENQQKSQNILKFKENYIQNIEKIYENRQSLQILTQPSFSSSPWSLSDNKLYQLNPPFLQTISISSFIRGTIPSLNQSTLYSQKITITAINPKRAKSVSIRLNSTDLVQLTGWEIALVVIGSIVVLIIGAIGIRWGTHKVNKHRKRVRLSDHFRAEDAELEDQEKERVSLERGINVSLRQSKEEQE